MTDADPFRLWRPRRTIDGCSAVLLPFLTDGTIDWDGLHDQLERTIAAGLRPAVNMDTGHVHLLDPAAKARVLDACADRATPGWFAGAVVRDEPGAAFDAKALASECESIARRGGVPVIFPSFGLAALDDGAWLDAHEALAEHADTFVAFELGTVFHPAGRIVDLDVYAGLLEIQACVGAKHSSLEREPEWARIALRDQQRPGFHVFTGNDLAIDMVMFGSDYLLGLSTFAPDAFALRDTMWARGDAGFFALNDVLQYLGQIAFRPPVPAYRHSAAQFLHLRGWLKHDNAGPGEPARPEADKEILAPIVARIDALIAAGVVTTDRTIGQVKKIASVDAFRTRCEELGITIAIDDEVDPRGSLAQPLTLAGRTVGNRFAILPMEGWDGTDDGRPTELVERRWRRFGSSGAKLVWGGEAAAVRPEGRANPHQLVVDSSTIEELAALRAALVDDHERHIGSADDLLIGLQLTHSGRFARPDGSPRPVIAYHHPVLDSVVGAETTTPISDDELDSLAATFIDAARLAQTAGFDFVDVKHCHGYLLHEMLSAFDRPGRFGGDFAGRTNFVRTVIAGIHAAAPDLAVGVRLSIFDLTPFAADDGPGRPVAGDGYRYAFGGDGTGLGIDLTEPSAFIELLHELGVEMICTTAGSPYYNPHVQRPAFFPPSDGYAPPEDPLIGVARQLDATAALKKAHPDVAFVGSAYSYLQDWLAHVAQRQVADGATDVVGLGRMALSYPDLPADVLAGRALDRPRVCRTFSDCTTAPRNGLVSGCYPLDPAYKTHPDRPRLVIAKREARSSRQ